jgi:hypothetical protein
MRTKKKQRTDAHKKFVSRSLAKMYLSKVKTNAEKDLIQLGLLSDPMRARLYTEVVPFLLDQAETFAEEIDQEKATLSELFDENLETHSKLHKKRVDDEHARLKR